MLSTPELRRLRDAIESLSSDAIKEIERRRVERSTEEMDRGREAGRSAMSVYGVNRSHDVMALAYYAKTTPGSAAWSAIAEAALAVGASPFGLARRDFHRLVGPLARYIPWLSGL